MREDYKFEFAGVTIMKYIFSVFDEVELKLYKDFSKRNNEKLIEFLDYLRLKLDVKEYPEYLVLCNLESATHTFSEIPIPAYTNASRIIFTPEIDVWRNIYLNQLEMYEVSEQIKRIESYYGKMNESYLMQIIGHELTHHSELFLDDFDDERESGIWFEEGMCEYISKKYFLSDKEYLLEKEINQTLVAIFEEKHTWKSLETFGSDEQDDSYAAIFYNYWRSFLTIDELVDKFGGIEEVFEKYKEWNLSGKKRPLVEWFKIE